MPDYEIREPDAEELRTFARAVVRGFAEFVEPEAMDDFESLLKRIDNLAAFDGPNIVGTMGVIDFQTSAPNIPGGKLQTGGVTIVTVAATHRRRPDRSCLGRLSQTPTCLIGRPNRPHHREN